MIERNKIGKMITPNKKLKSLHQIILYKLIAPNSPKNVLQIILENPLKTFKKNRPNLFRQYFLPKSQKFIYHV